MILVRAATSDDHAALAALFAQMQAHYAVPCPPLDEIVAGLASRPAGVELMVAERSGVLVGFAAFAAIYPGPGLKPGLFMKELYVAAGARGMGAGRALMRALAREAVSRRLSRIDWTADVDDVRLLAFYAALGGKPQPKKLFFRLTGEALDDLGRG
jgi:ribosomal protein S18 acetylase RimI-like enzyme